MSKIRLISLNTWGGQLRQELREFIERERDGTDIFCFQEVFDNAVHVRKVLGDVDIDTFKTLQALLPDHEGYYAPSQADDEGLAIFVKPWLEPKRIGSMFVHRHLNAMEGEDGTTIGRNIQFLQFIQEGKEYTVINFHGLWNGGGKGDSPDRLSQSRKLRKFMDELASRRNILIGDFNLEPETESVAILEKGMRNLIKESGVTSSRTKHYTKPVRFADYAIVSNDLKVVTFEVMPDEVSDHSPLLLEFK